MKLTLFILLLCLMTSCKIAEKTEEEIELIGLEVAKELIEDEMEAIKK